MIAALSYFQFAVRSPAAPRVGELRPSAATSRSAEIVWPSSSVATTPAAPRVTDIALAGIRRSICSAASAASRSTRRRMRFSTIVPSASCAGVKSSASVDKPSRTSIRLILQPKGASFSASPIASSIRHDAEAIAEARPSKVSDNVVAGSAGSTTTVRTPCASSASASVRPTSPPPRIRISVRCMARV